MKNIIPLLSFLALVGCAAPAWRANITPESKYKINSVTTKLESLCPAPNFMSSDNLSKEFDKVVKETFCSKKTCVTVADKDTIVVDIYLIYHRTFMGEAFGCNESYAGADIKYAFNLKKNGQVFYEQNTSNKYVPSRGLFGNLGRIGSQLSFSGGPENEKDDLDHLMPGIAKQIAKDLE